MISSRQKLKAEMENCLLHEDRLKISLQEVRPFFPLTSQFFEKPQRQALAFLDMLTMRFAKLQDTLGRKIFPEILKLTDEYLEEETFIDRLNRLERLEVIDSVAQWASFRSIRNAIAHEYENDLVKLCAILNQFIQKCDELLLMWENVKAYIEKKALL